MPAFTARSKKAHSAFLVIASLTFSAAFAAANAQSVTAATATQRVSVLDVPYTDAAGNVWAARTGFEGGWTWAGPSASQDIAGTVDDALYRPELVRMAAWRSAPLPADTYQVTLKLREAWYGAPGQRVFDVKAEGVNQLTAVDIYAGAGRFTAYDKTFLVKVTDGTLDLEFVNVDDNAIVSAIEVKPYVAPVAADGAFRMTVQSTALTDGAGRTWAARSGFTGGSFYLPPHVQDVAGTTDDNLYRPEYWGLTGWRRRLAHGSYTITLRLREARWNAPGKRVFDVVAEGKTVLTGLDIYREAGAVTALDKSFPVTVTDGELTLGFTARADLPAVSAIQVTPAATPTPTPEPEPTPVGQPTAEPTPTPTPTTAPNDASNVTLRPVDGGGPSYYGRFATPLPSAPTYFPIGVWLAGVPDATALAKDKQAGINLYAGLAGNTDYALLATSGMGVLAQHDLAAAGAANVANGWFLSDEADMWAGPGEAAWTGNWPGNGQVCLPDGADCGYTVQREVAARTPNDGRLRWSNYGKGILFWQRDADAGRFVNDYQDVVSADAYWFTDNAICSTWEGGRFLFPSAPRALTQAECRRPANYGALVRRVRSLVSPAGSKPVWAYVELGHPSGDPAWPTATPSQVKAAVWSSVIAGARGIVYFNHSFGGNCVSYNILRDPCYAATRTTVAAVNAQLTELAPVLNGPDVHGLVVDAPQLDTLVKSHQGDLYVFAQSTSTTSQSQSIATSCRLETTAVGLGESRSVPVTAGTITDSYRTDEPTHIYKIAGGSTRCAVPSS